MIEAPAAVLQSSYCVIHSVLVHILTCRVANSKHESLCAAAIFAGSFSRLCFHALQHGLAENLVLQRIMPSSPRRALVIVDMSHEQVSAIKHNRKQVIQNCQRLALNENGFFDLCIDCRLWLSSPKESSLSWVWPETAISMFVAGSEGASLISELCDIRPSIKFVPKNNYSCFAKSTLLSTLQEAKIDQVYICGINTDYCVFATAMDSFQHQFRTFVVADAVTSVRGRDAHVQGLHNLERHFSEKALVLTSNIISSS